MTQPISYRVVETGANKGHIAARDYRGRLLCTRPTRGECEEAVDEMRSTGTCYDREPSRGAGNVLTF